MCTPQLNLEQGKLLSIKYLVSTELNTFLVHLTIGVQQISECIVWIVTWF